MHFFNKLTGIDMLLQAANVVLPHAQQFEVHDDPAILAAPDVHEVPQGQVAPAAQNAPGAQAAQATEEAPVVQGVPVVQVPGQFACNQCNHVAQTAYSLRMHKNVQ